MGGLVIGVILILIGISAIVGISLFKFIFAIIVIVIGVRLIVGRSIGGPGSWQWHRHYGDDPHRMAASDDMIDEVAVFSPLNKAFTSAHLKGGKIVAVFSGAEIDLSGAHAAGPEVDLEVSSVFASVEITIPKNWKVRTSAAAFIGSVDTHRAPDGDASVTLVLHGQAVFGGIEVQK